MKLIIFILSISSWDIAKVATETCSQPEVRNALMHIYQTADTKVTVYHCLYQDRLSYSDITKNCINAFKTRRYIDKWSETNHMDTANPTMKIETYTTNANIMQNKITLKSGTVCRYDRGFCYDPLESPNFAAVWEVSNKKPNMHAEDLIEIFYGWVDIWEFRNSSVKFLVFQDNKRDISFALQLVRQGKLDAKNFWYTDRDGIIVSNVSLKKTRPVPHLSQQYFPLKPKQAVSEQVLTNCDLQNFPLDFEKNTHENYILDQNNLLDILAIFQKELLETKKKFDVTPSSKKENAEINKAITKLQKDMSDTKTSLLAKDKELQEIGDMIRDMLNAVSKKDLDVSTLQEKIKGILDRQQGSDVKFGQIVEKLTVLENQLSRLNDDSNEKEINTKVAKLENNFNVLKTTLSEKNKDILKGLDGKNKLIDDIKNSLNDLYSKIQNTSSEQKKEQEKTIQRLFNIELDLKKQNNNIMKFENYTNQTLTQKNTEINTKIKGRYTTLEQKYNSILAKLNLHDMKISKCENSTILLSNKDKLEEVEGDIRKIEGEVLQAGGEIGDLLNKHIALKKNVHEIDGVTTKLKEDLAHKHQEFINLVNKNNHEMKMMKEKSEQCLRAVDTIKKSKDKRSDEIQRSLIDMRSNLTKQDQDILMILGILNELNDKSSANYTKFIEAIKDCKRSVDVKLQAKEEEIVKIHENLREKDGEIKKLHGYFKKIHEKSNEFENKLNRCQLDADRKLKEKDNAIKRLQDDLRHRGEKFQAEQKKRDQEYKTLQEEIKKINEVIGQSVTEQ